MTTADLTPEVVERIKERVADLRARAYFRERRVDSPAAAAMRQEAEDLEALLSRLSHLEEQARKDGEALEAAHPLLETLHSITPKGDANNIVWRTIKVIRARLSDREGK